MLRSQSAIVDGNIMDHVSKKILIIVDVLDVIPYELLNVTG